LRPSGGTTGARPSTAMSRDSTAMATARCASRSLAPLPSRSCRPTEISRSTFPRVPRHRGFTVTIATAPAGVFGPNQIGGAYRLGPDGTTFSGPVTITLRVPSIPTNVRSSSLQLGLRSSDGDISGLSTLLAPHPDGGFTLTSATSHFTDVGVLPDSLPLDRGLMQLSCSIDGAAPFDCTQGPLNANVGYGITIQRVGGLAGLGNLNLASTNTSDVPIVGANGFVCNRVGTSFVTAAATAVPAGLPVTPLTHLFVACKPPDVTNMFFATSPGLPSSGAAPRLDSVFVGRTEDGFAIGVQPGAPTGLNAFGALFLENPATGQVEALTSRGEFHTGPNIGDVGGQVFFNQNGMPFPPGFGVSNSPDVVRYDIPTSAGKRGIIIGENTSAQGFDSDSFSVKVAGSVATQLGSSVGGQNTPCEASATTLCLREDRFKVTVKWDSGPASGVGSTFDPGYEGGMFWFFDQTTPRFWYEFWMAVVARPITTGSSLGPTPTLATPSPLRTPRPGIQPSIRTARQHGPGNSRHRSLRHLPLTPDAPIASGEAGRVSASEVSWVRQLGRSSAQCRGARLAGR